MAKLGDLSVTFGHGSTPGLIISNGTLTSLDMIVNAQFQVDVLTIYAQNLEFDYTPTSSGYTFTILGAVGPASRISARSTSPSATARFQA